jgi:hypothetical protein
MARESFSEAERIDRVMTGDKEEGREKGVPLVRREMVMALHRVSI